MEDYPSKSTEHEDLQCDSDRIPTNAANTSGQIGEKTSGTPSKAAEDAVSALSTVEPTAPRRSTRPIKNNLCVKCNVLVSKIDDAMLCDFCCRWEHLECSPIGIRLHSYLQNDPVEQLLYVCSKCHELRRRGQSITLPSLQGLNDGNHPASESVLTQRTLRSRVININDQRSSVNPNEDLDMSTPPEEEESDSTIVAPTPKKTPRRTKRKSLKKKKATTSSSTPVVEVCSEDEPSENEWVTVTKQRSRIPAAPSHPPGDFLQQPTHQTRGTPPRENCVIIFRLPESEDPSPSVRYDDDIRALGTMVSKMLNQDEPGVTVERVIRIGRKTEGRRSRPLKVVLNSSSEAELLLARSFRLRGTPWLLRPDLSPEDRDKQRVAVQQLKELKAQGQTNLTIRNFRVVRKRLYKEPVTLRAVL